MFGRIEFLRHLAVCRRASLTAKYRTFCRRITGALVRLKRTHISKSTLSHSAMSEIVVKALTPSLRDDFLFFFDHVVFPDNPEWSDCYCSAYHFANKGKAESRRQASSLLEEDRIHGFLAYDNGKPATPPFTGCWALARIEQSESVQSSAS